MKLRKMKRPDVFMPPLRYDYTLPRSEEKVLFPSYHGELCPFNGDHEGVECCCDECDHYLICFPDWKELMQQGD